MTPEEIRDRYEVFIQGLISELPIQEGDLVTFGNGHEYFYMGEIFIRQTSYTGNFEIGFCLYQLLPTGRKSSKTIYEDFNRHINGLDVIAYNKQVTYQTLRKVEKE